MNGFAITSRRQRVEGRSPGTNWNFLLGGYLTFNDKRLFIQNKFFSIAGKVLNNMIILLIFISFSSSIIAGINKISDYEFEHTDTADGTKKIKIEKEIEKIAYIAVIQQAGYIRYLIRTVAGTFYLHHEIFEVPDSPLVRRVRQFTDEFQNKVYFDTDALTFMARQGAFPDQEKSATPYKHYMITTALRNAQRSSDGSQCQLLLDDQHQTLDDLNPGLISIDDGAFFLVIPHQVDQWLQWRRQTNLRIGHGRTCHRAAVSLEHILLPVQWQGIAILGDNDPGQWNLSSDKLL